MMHSWTTYSWWGPSPLGGFGPIGFLLAGIFLAAVIVLKGFALWYSARRGEKWWFVIMLVINTAGILELVYLVFFVHKLHQRARTNHHDHSSHDRSHPHDHGHSTSS